MSLAKQLRQIRESQGLTLDEVANDAGISKTYLWELEKDSGGEKKPSAYVLMQIARALSVTIADLLDLPVALLDEQLPDLPRALREFSERMKKLGTPLSHQDLRELALMKFRGAQPRTVDEWNQLYLALAGNRTSKRRR